MSLPSGLITKPQTVGKIRKCSYSCIWSVHIWHPAPKWMFTQLLSLISFSNRLYIPSDLSISSYIQYTKQTAVNLCIIKHILQGTLDIVNISIRSFAVNCATACYWIWGGHPIIVKFNEIWRLARKVLSITTCYLLKYIGKHRLYHHEIFTHDGTPFVNSHRGWYLAFETPPQY